VQGADKLLKLMVDVGTETRQILPGLPRLTPPESLVGRKIVSCRQPVAAQDAWAGIQRHAAGSFCGDEGQPVLASFS
jgi:hypothetical protein